MLNEGQPVPGGAARCISSLFKIGYIDHNRGFWRSSLFWDVTQRWLVVSCRSCGTAFRSHLQASSSPRRSRRCILLWYDASSVQKIHLRMYLFQSNCTYLRKHAYYDFSDTFRLRTKLTHFFNVFIFSLLYMFRATECSSSGESKCINTSSGIYHSCVGGCLVCRSGIEFLSDRHTRQSPTQSDDIYQVMYWYNSILLMMSTGLLETCREGKNKYIEKSASS